MRSIVALFVMFFSASAVAQQGDTATTGSHWQNYGYIILGVIILVVAVVVLIRKQYRKFNE